jgi:hypothetical protein
MMPTFPRSSLSLRTAGFPSTAGRLAYQGDLPESVNQLKPAPGMRAHKFRNVNDGLLQNLAKRGSASVQLNQIEGYGFTEPLAAAR